MDAGTTPARRCCWLSWALLLVAAPTTMVAPRVAEGNDDVVDGKVKLTPRWQHPSTPLLLVESGAASAGSANHHDDVVDGKAKLAPRWQHPSTSLLLVESGAASAGSANHHGYASCG
ncbi:hypothetical protein H0E87_026038 [Populus deltoides]|uniref:Uncharacterized protein n=1 Tax=Populus deltoides TaxID=3696 RepID=A0A8T2X2I0_POPDE|nr:hypothetical protein H0E87_026038 [Populus deltoides]